MNDTLLNRWMRTRPGLMLKIAKLQVAENEKLARAHVRIASDWNTVAEICRAEIQLRKKSK